MTEHSAAQNEPSTGVASVSEGSESDVAKLGVSADNKRWYVLHVYSGTEKSVAKHLQERVGQAGLSGCFGRILVPTEEVIEVRSGRKAITERRLYSGYVLIEMEMTDEAWHLVRSTPKVSGFLGGKANRPAPLSAKEVGEILARMQEGVERPKPKILFEVGEMVRVKEGPFADFNGNVEDVNYDKNRVRVTVTIFGRSTPVDLEFGQVEKV